jgi:hypothetical protein
LASSRSRRTATSRRKLIVPIGSIRQFVIGPPEPARARFGFSVPEE